MFDKNADCFARGDAIIALQESGDSRAVELSLQLLGNLVEEQKELGFMAFRDQYSNVGALIEALCGLFRRLGKKKVVRDRAGQIHEALDRVADEFADPMMAAEARNTRKRLIEMGVVRD